MNLSASEIDIFNSVLRTLIYNTTKDLKEKLIRYKSILNSEKYSLLMFGNGNLYNENCDLENKEMYKVIKELDYRWCLSSILYYHLIKTKKISKEEYNEILSI